MLKLKNIAKSTISALGVIGTLVTIIWAIFQDRISETQFSYPWLVLLLFFVIALLYALYVNRKKSCATLKLTDNVTASVYFGDLFSQNGILVIPVNEYFDTIVDDEIISSNTLHGMFVKKYFNGNDVELSRKIQDGLVGSNGVLTIRDNSVWSGHKYPLGTVCRVFKENKTFFLVALTKFNENDRAEVENSEYQRVLCDLLSYIEQHSQGKPVNIPLIGAGHSGVNLSKQKLLDFLLFSIYLKDKLTLVGGVNVVLHDSLKKEIDLSITETIFRSIRS